MRRTLKLTAILPATQGRLEAIGKSYLAKARSKDKMTKAQSIASYEDGGLEKVFTAILKAPDWNDPLLQAFNHFLVKHIMFDSDPEKGHGALCRHLKPDDRILPLWTAFRQILIEGAPGFAA